MNPLGAIALVAAMSAAGAAGATDVPIAQQAFVLVRALAYDRDLAAGAAGSVDIAIVTLPKFAAANRKVVAAFQQLRGNTVAGLPVQVHLLIVGSLEGLSGKLSGMDALYLTAGMDGDQLAGILAVARAAQVTTLAAERGYVEKGAALGVFVVSERPTILVNVAAAKGEGAAFSSELFKIAQPLR